MSAQDRDPELAEDRAVAAKIQEFCDMTVAEFIADVGIVKVRVGSVATDKFLASYVALSQVRIDLQSLVEAAAENAVNAS